MDAERNDSPQRLALCLVADEQALDCLATAIRYLLIGLIDECIDPILVAPEQSPAEAIAAGPTTVIPYRHSVWPLARWTRHRVVADVRRQLDTLPRNTPVIIHSLTPAVLAIAADLAAAADGDLVVSLSAEADVDHPDLAAHAERIAQLITPAQRVRQALQASPLAHKPVEIVPLGVIASASPAAFKGPQLTPAVVFAGELSAPCGGESLIRAAKRVLQDHPNLLVFIIGKGPAENSLRHLVESLDLQAAVTFTGRLEHWRTALEAADIFCLPRAGETFREEPIHALAAGLAVVAADDSPYDGFIDGKTALLFSPGDEVGIADRICRLLDNPELSARLAAAAQAHARANHSVARMVADHVRLYRQLETRSRTLTLAGSRSPANA